jgi:nitrite reductase/ring-hydroxylating ferredoxin subunit
MGVRASQNEETAPHPDFVNDLRHRLAQELEDGPTPAPTPRVSRRQLLGGAGIAAAAAGVAVAIDRTAFAPSSQSPAQQKLSPNGGTWHTVALTSSLAEGVVTRFDTSAAVGFVANDRGTLRAVSGVCTHQGCLLQANQPARRLDCPCHQTAFSFSGDLLFAQLPTPPGPLPQLQVREQNGQVQVLLPPPV